MCGIVQIENDISQLFDQTYFDGGIDDIEIYEFKLQLFGAEHVKVDKET